MRPTFEIKVMQPEAKPLSETEKELVRDCLLILLNAASKINERILTEYPTMPRIYDSGVLYQQEKDGKERWKDLPSILADRGGDCEDLSTARCAELRRGGIRAHPWLSWIKEGARYIYHVRVWRESIDRDLPPVEMADGRPVIIPAPTKVGGWIEDPSLALGM